MTKFNTEQMLIMRYGFTPLIPLDKVASDYLPPLTKPELHRKAKHGQLGFSVVNNGSESKPAYYVPLASLAAWIDHEISEANSDHLAMQA